jgi:hypothetical protein
MTRLTIALVLTAATACLGAADDAGAPPEPTPGIRVVTGLITDLTDERMTVRDDDGSELVFTLTDDPPVSVDHLRDHMEGLLPVRVTYRQESTQLIPIAIDDV